jgi:hypothetical protein
MKSENLIPKSEGNPHREGRNPGPRAIPAVAIWISGFRFVSDFEFRISDLGRAA